MINGGAPGGKGVGANYVSIGEVGRVIAAGTTFFTTVKAPLFVTGYPRISFYVLVTSGAGNCVVLEQFTFTNNLVGGGRAWLPVRGTYNAVLNTPELNGNDDGHADPAFIPCTAVRLSLTAPGGNAQTVTWYIAASV